MKHFLRLMGQLCPLSNHYKTKLTAMVAVMTLFMCLIAAFKAPAQTGAAANMDEIQPLQIGDTIPEALWHLPLQVVNHPEGKETITLNDYRGKLIILDFWGTYCTTCIFNMPYLHGLENTFKEDLVIVPVTNEKPDRVVRFLETNSILKPLNLLSVTQGDALFETFPSQTLPHIVLIDQHASLIAITMAEYLNKDVIGELIAGKDDVYIPRKRQSLKQPVLQLADSYLDVKINQGVYYSALSGFIDGLSHDTRLETDLENHAKRFVVSNIFIAKLYTTGLRSALPLQPKRRILEVAQPERYVIPSDYRDIDARRRNFYTYESISPVWMDEAQILNNMKDDLDRYLGLHGRIESRTIRCLVLRHFGNDTSFASVDDNRVKVVEGKIGSRFFEKRKEVGVLPNGVDTYLRYSKFAEIAGLIDEIVDEPLPIILDETGYQGHYDLEFPSPNNATLETVNEFLQARGLQLCWADREMDMFVLSESGYDSPRGSLELSDIGYTYLVTPK